MRRTATTTIAAGAALTAATVGGATAWACFSPASTAAANSRTAPEENTATAAREDSPEPEATFSAQGAQSTVTVRPVAVAPAAKPAAKSDPDDARAHKAKVHASSERPSDRDQDGDREGDRD